jgi:hypothetical protein
MTLIETLLAPRVIVILIAFTLLAGLEPWFEQWLGRVFKHNRPFAWCWDALLYPLLRAVLVTALVIALYPSLFGLVEAPAIGELFAGGHARLNNLLGGVFLFTLLLPAIPLASREPAFMLPLQGILATAIVYNWLTRYLGATAVAIWPGNLAALTLLVLAWFSHQFARTLAAGIGATLDQAWHLDGTAIPLQRGIALLAQGPIVLLYGYLLGRQIAI